MEPVYFTAARLRDFGVARLAEHLLCTLREVPGFRGRPSVLDENLTAIETEPDLRERVRQSAEVAAFDAISPELADVTAKYVEGQASDTELLDSWQQETLRRIGDAPYRLGSPTLQLPFPARLSVEIVALVLAARRKLGGLPAVPDLIDMPVPEDAIVFGDRGQSIVIVGDPQDGALSAMLREAAAVVGDQKARWVWMNAPVTETPTALWLAIETEKRLARLAGSSIETVAAALSDPLPPAPPLLNYPDDPRVKTVLRQLAILDACGVPRSRRPALVIGRTLYLKSPGLEFARQVRTNSQSTVTENP